MISGDKLCIRNDRSMFDEGQLGAFVNDVALETFILNSISAAMTLRLPYGDICKIFHAFAPKEELGGN